MAAPELQWYDNIGYLGGTPFAAITTDQAMFYAGGTVASPYSLRFTDSFITPVVTGSSAPPWQYGMSFTVGDQTGVCGSLVTMQTNWHTNYGTANAYPTQPAGPVTMQFVDSGGAPVAASTSTVYIRYNINANSFFDPDDTEPWTTPLEGLRWVPLNSAGGDLGSPQEFIDDGGLAHSVYSGTHYGWRAYHLHPGTGAPAVWAMNDIALTIRTGPTFLRQRQSPLRSPSRVSWKVF